MGSTTASFCQGFPRPIQHFNTYSSLGRKSHDDVVRKSKILIPTSLLMSNDINRKELKNSLEDYLQKRKENNADEIAQNEVGKVVGGTKGNAVLEFISGSPNREFVIEEAPDIFDYSELSKYGYSDLIEPIMHAGGRREMYDLMGLPTPSLPERIKKKKSVPKLVIDRTGDSDKARYTGLKVTQILDDDELGRKLSETQEKLKRGQALKNKLVEENYVMPFADKRNTGPRQVPDWTPDRLDEEGLRIGQAQAWVRKSRAGEFLIDRFEILSIDGNFQLYSIFSTIIVAFAFGKATSRFCESFQLNNVNTLLEAFQGIGLGIILASIGSSITCAFILAPEKNRNSLVWGIKGYAAGPLAVLELRKLQNLQTRGEYEREK